ncbi:Fc receptor-like protein 2 [Acipenser ruthenus]|uniref:Fc receptor-like protein 2 n=1 Tax=Acipenser ruthenus TaxID=7906 RepID=UPI0027414D78|nr:Fc receptor-like protein 2 [Acipenser ruthenus]
MDIWCGTPMQEEDMLFIAASGEGASFSSDMQVGETHAEEEPCFEVASEGADKLGLAGFPPVDSTIVAVVKAPSVGGLARDSMWPNTQCRVTNHHIQQGTGDTVTLSCVVEGGSGGWRYLWYKDRQGAPVNQTYSSSGTGAGYTISAAALSHSGEYWCRAGRGRNTSYSQYSHPIWVNVTALFSRVTLTASPGATVKEGEALNLTCEAAVNKTPRPQLHYTIVRDGEPVTNSTDSALYSIASTEKSHTGSYTCAVESQGVKKSSQELHIEVETSWHSAAAAAGFSVGFFVILLIVFTLLLLYHKIRGFPCITGGKRRERSDQNQDQAAGGVELSSQAQQPDSEDIVYSEIDTSKHNNTKKAKPAETDTVYSAVKISAGKPTADNAESMYATVLPKKKRK